MAGGEVHIDKSPWEQLLLNAAEPILNSADIRQALDQSATDVHSVRELIVQHTTDLFCARDNPDFLFVAEASIPGFARERSAYLPAGLVALAMIDGFTPAWVGLSFTLFYAVLCLTMASYLVINGGQRFEPTEETRRALERLVIGPFLREQINQLLARNEGAGVMRVTSAPGLAELSEREQVISTDTLEGLSRLSQAMASGSIGISGPRGVGKTTLLRYLCDPALGGMSETSLQSLINAQDYRLMISAPVEYDTRDFILHLFEKFCETVLQLSPHGTPRDAVSMTGERRLAKTGMVVLGSLLTGLGTALGIYTLLNTKRLPRITKLDDYLAVAAAALIIGLVLLGWQLIAMPLRRFRYRRKGGIKDEARAWLTRIRFLQTLTRELSGSMTLPLSAKAGITTSQQYAELQLTLPELVDRFRDFSTRAIAARAQSLPESGRDQALVRAMRLERRRQVLASAFGLTASTLRPWPLIGWAAARLNRWSMRAANRATLSHGVQTYLREPGNPLPQPRIVIGIDEIDRMSTESAERFLNEIKAIFGIRRCLYLVSVSDEALAVFEQRVLQGRSVFDSTFDEVVRARELTFGSCKQLLRRRIAGIPDTLIAFCQVMSGGLPRDLIRTARQVVETCAAGETEVSALVAAILAEQINVLKRSLVSMAGDSRSDPAVKSILRFLIQADWPGPGPSSVLAAIQADLASLEFGSGLKATLYFYATVGEIFGEPELAQTVRALLVEASDAREHTTDADHVDRLAYARNLISVNEEAAWQLIDAFRAARGLRVVDSSVAAGR